MSSEPLVQSEMLLRSGKSECVRAWNLERKKTRFQVAREMFTIRILLPVLGALIALIESLDRLPRIPGPILMIGSLLVSVAIYSSRMGWKMASGFMTLLLIHECGHLLAARHYGTSTSVPIFIPYIGAVIDLKQSMRNAWEEAVFGISGPALGSLGAFVCLGIHHFTGRPFFAELAFFGFSLNLFNLIPLGFLDGGHVAVALTRWLWIPGFIMLAAFVWFIHAPVAILMLVVTLPMVLGLFRKPPSGQRSYDRVSLPKRLIIGVLYVGLVGILSVSMALVFVKDIYPRLKAEHPITSRDGSARSSIPAK